MGAVITAAVTTTGDSKALQIVPTDAVKVGDLGDLEQLAADADLLVTHSHGCELRSLVRVEDVGLAITDESLLDRLYAESGFHRD